LASCQPAFIPQEDDSQVRRVVVLPVVPSLRSTERGWKKVPEVVAEKKLVGGSATSTPAAPSATAPQTEASFSLRLNR